MQSCSDVMSGVPDNAFLFEMVEGLSFETLILNIFLNRHGEAVNRFLFLVLVSGCMMREKFFERFLSMVLLNVKPHLASVSPVVWIHRLAMDTQFQFKNFREPIDEE
ncbi:MAG: hypothetical protein JWM20_372 [Patescibacteria group bacterium]|nr:hypothetical protein [Patescibacteria group bacterium]